MLTRVITTALIATGAFAQSNLNPGIKASLDIAVLEQAKDVYFDNIVTLINSLTIPDFEDNDGNYLRGNSFVLNQRSDNVYIYPNTANNALVMRCEKLSGVFYNDAFRYKVWPFTAKGHLDVKINTILVQFGIGFATTDIGARRLPYINSADVDIDINRFDINIQIWGNIWSDFASLFEVFFVGTVADLIDDAMTYGLQTGIPTVGNALIQKSDGYFPIPLYADWKLDWETQYRANVTNTYFQVGVKGLFFDKSEDETAQEPEGVFIPALPDHNTTRAEKFQATVSAYTIDTFFQSWLRVGNVQAWFNASMIPANSTVQLTTAELDVLMPGMSDYYGVLPVNIFFKIKEFGNIGIYEENQVMDGTLSVETQFWVQFANNTQEMAASVDLEQLNFGFSAVITNMNVSVALTEIKSVEVVVNSCAFGTISARIFKLKLNLVFTTFKVFINQWIGGMDIVIPSNIAGIFILSDLYIEYYNDYIYAGATPTFIGDPATAAAMYTQMTASEENPVVLPLWTNEDETPVVLPL